MIARNCYQRRSIFSFLKGLSKPQVTIFIYAEGERVNLTSVRSLISKAKENETLLSKVFENDKEILK